MPCGISSHFVATTLLWCFFCRTAGLISWSFSSRSCKVFRKMAPKPFTCCCRKRSHPRSPGGSWGWEPDVGLTGWTQQISGENHPVILGGPWIFSCVHFYVGGWLHKLCIVMQDYLLSHYSSHGFTHTTSDLDYQTPKEVLLKVGCSLQVSKWPWKMFTDFRQTCHFTQGSYKVPRMVFCMEATDTRFFKKSTAAILITVWMQHEHVLGQHWKRGRQGRSTRLLLIHVFWILLGPVVWWHGPRYQIPDMAKDPMVVTTCMNYNKIVVNLCIYTYVYICM